MGTHPIFESDFDCLTEWQRKRKFSVLITRHCESTSAPTDPPLFRRIPDGSTPTKCAVAGSTTPTSTDAYTSANTWERTPKSAATSVTTFCNSATEISSNKWTSNERTRFPSQVYSRSVKDSFEWEPKHEAWKINAEAGKAREAEYREFFQPQK